MEPREISHEERCRVITVAVSVVAGMLLSVMTSGCGMMGVREADLWGAKFTFAEGLDFHVGANQIDRVDDRRGVSPVKLQGHGGVEAQGAVHEKY